MSDQLSRGEKINICIRELYSNEQFLVDYGEELINLHNSASFMQVISSILGTAEAKNMYASSKSSEIQEFKAKLNDIIRTKGVYFNYPDYTTIGDKMAACKATQKSTAISVFYAMVLLSLQAEETQLDTAIDELVIEYSNVFEKFREEELFKWEAVKCFQDNWDPDAPNFYEMLRASLEKSSSLLSGGTYYPRRMLREFAEINSEKVKHALADVLFDERIELIERMKQFESLADELLVELNDYRKDHQIELAKSHFQDPRAMCAYLSFAHPEAGYLYKYSMYYAATERLGIKREKDKFLCASDFETLCNKILENIKTKHPDLLARNDATLPEELKNIDPEYHLLVQDITYYINNWEDKYLWHPTEDEYSPGLSTDDWQDLLQDESIISPQALTTLKCLLEFPKGATCKELSTKFGRTSNYYNFALSHFAKRVHEKTECPLYVEDSGQNKFWPIPCLGRSVPSGGNGVFAWKLRDELTEALESIDLSNYPLCETEEESEEVTLGSNIILYGPPGTGKTYSVAAMAWLIANGEKPTLESLNSLTQKDRETAKIWYDEQLNDQDNGQVAFTTFHQSFGYEEFIEGIRPVVVETDDGSDGSAGLRYDYEDGIFKSFCERAEANNKPYIFVIDEINRGNISKIFGELITLIEPSKRKGQPDQQTAILPYTKQSFSIPSNITIIGTMNTADRSIALMDTALRRRFDFIEMMPNYDILKSVKVGNIEIAKMLERINQRIEVLMDRDHTIGHAYFVSLIDSPSIERLAGIFKNKVLPLLQEYFYDDYEKIRLVLADNQKDDESRQFIIEENEHSSTDLFGDEDYRYGEAKSYRINDGAFSNPDAYHGIYE